MTFSVALKQSRQVSPFFFPLVVVYDQRNLLPARSSATAINRHIVDVKNPVTLKPQ